MNLLPILIALASTDEIQLPMAAESYHAVAYDSKKRLNFPSFLL